MEDPPSLTLEDLFTQEAKNPFTYDLNLTDLNQNSTPLNVFESIKNIFIKGLIIITDGEALNSENKSSIDIDRISENDFKKVRERMLSIGIEAKYKVYDSNDKDFYLRGLMYSLEKIEGIKMSATLDWHTQYVQKIDFHLKDKELVEKLMETLEKHPEANYFLNMNKPKNLKDFLIKFVKKEEEDKLHVIYFDVAKISDHHYRHKFCDVHTKHVR